MARIIYALSGQGRGHTSRVIAISDALRKCGHEILFCCGGTARDILESRGETTLPVPVLCHVMRDNTLQHGETIHKNLKTIRKYAQIVARLADAFAAYHPDLLITDFEVFSARAARRIDLPVLSFNHQQVVTETRYPLPWRYRLHALIATFIIKIIAPKNPEHLLLSSFFFPPLKHPARTTLLPPIIRPDVQALHPKRGEHVLVYYNQPEGSYEILDQFRQVDASFILYNFKAPEQPERYPNITFKEPSMTGFLKDLAESRAVICTAGFTLISEALYLGKPLLVIPNRGIFEQTLNALFLQREGLGNAVIDRPLAAHDVSTFLERLDLYEERLHNRPTCGNKAAIECIEGVLSRIGSSMQAPPRPSHRPVTTASWTDAMVGSE